MDHPEPVAKPATISPKPLRCRTQGLFADWLASSNGCLAVTTYTSGKLAFVCSSAGRVRYRTHQFIRPMGLAFDKKHFALATRDRIFQFRCQNPTSNSSTLAHFVPDQEFLTGRLDAHELAFGERGLYFANTKFNCIARVSKDKKFICTWRPEFITELVAQDRCHLNGIGLKNNRPGMATAFCATNHKGGWRELDRLTGGVLFDVPSKQVVAEGLCMPHSPRWHHDKWWVCNSGHGTLEVFDPQSSTCQEVCSLPGFTRGLCFVDDYALVGLSKVRRKHILDAPPVRARHNKLISGVALVHLATGRHVGTLEFTQGGREVFDIAFVAGIERLKLSPFVKPK